MATKKEYTLRSDEEKIRAQWVKLTGLHTREEWSAAVVRAATAVELAANLAIRCEFRARSDFDTVFVDKLLVWANGLRGKLDNILLPMLEGQEKRDAIQQLCPLAWPINKKRNDIAHSGFFCSAEEAEEHIGNCKLLVLGIVQQYIPNFDLRKKRRQKAKR